MKRLRTACISASLVVVLATPAQSKALSGSAESNQALALCKSAERTAGSEKVAMLDRGLALAEQAIATDDTDAVGHFALFCNLGRGMQLHPLSLGSLAAVRRLRREIDRALELAPDATQLLVAKAMFLLELPHFLGGDQAEAEHLLRRAVDLDPANARARVALGRLYMVRNQRDAAAVQVRAALSLMDQGLSHSETAEAHTLLVNIER